MLYIYATCMPARKNEHALRSVSKERAHIWTPECSQVFCQEHTHAYIHLQLHPEIHVGIPKWGKKTHTRGCHLFQSKCCSVKSLSIGKIYVWGGGGGGACTEQAQRQNSLNSNLPALGSKCMLEPLLLYRDGPRAAQNLYTAHKPHFLI